MGANESKRRTWAFHSKLCNAVPGQAGPTDLIEIDRNGFGEAVSSAAETYRAFAEIDE